MRKTLIIILISFSSITLFSQNKIPDEVVGTWISVQFKQSLNDSLIERLTYGNSPQILTIDSSGQCLVQGNTENLFSIGRPQKVFESKNYKEVLYNHKKREYYLTFYMADERYLLLGVPGTPFTILFTRYISKVARE